METAILVGIGILAVGFLVRRFIKTAKVEGCACCGQTCGSHCQTPDDKNDYELTPKS